MRNQEGKERLLIAAIIMCTILLCLSLVGAILTEKGTSAQLYVGFVLFLIADFVAVIGLLDEYD